MRRLWLVLGLLGLAAPVGAQNVQRGIPVNCVVEVSTATTLTLITGPGRCLAAQRERTDALYITDITVGLNATGIAADSFPTLKYGTGTTCGTGTTIFWLAIIGNGTATTTPFTVVDQLATPIRIPPLNDLCWISSTAASKTWVITGFIAP